MMDQSQFGMSDFITLICQARWVYQQARDCNNLYADLQKDLLTLKNYLENVEDHINSGKMSFSMLPTLFEIGHRCRATLTSLEIGISNSDENSVRADPKLDARNRESRYYDTEARLSSNIDAIVVFYRSIVSDVQFKLSVSLDQLLNDTSSRRFDVISESTLKSAIGSAKDQNYHQAWHAITMYLQELDVNATAIVEQQQFISTRIRSSIDRKEYPKSISSRNDDLLVNPPVRSSSASLTPMTPNARSKNSYARNSHHTPSSSRGLDEQSPLDHARSCAQPSQFDASPLQIAETNTGVPQNQNSATSDRPDSMLIPLQSPSSIVSTERNISSSSTTALDHVEHRQSLPVVEPFQESGGARTRVEENLIQQKSEAFPAVSVPTSNHSLYHLHTGADVDYVSSVQHWSEKSRSSPGRLLTADSFHESSLSYTNDVVGLDPANEIQSVNIDQNYIQRSRSCSSSINSAIPLEDSDSTYYHQTSVAGFSSSRTALLDTDSHSSTGVNLQAAGSRFLHPSKKNGTALEIGDLSSDKELDLSGTYSPGNKIVTNPGNEPESWCKCRLTMREASRLLQEHDWTAAERQVGSCMASCRCGNLQSQKLIEELLFLRGACLSFSGEFSRATQCFSPILLHTSHSSQHDPILRLAALIWTGDASLCTGYRPLALIAWILALQCLESELLNSAHPTTFKARMLLPIHGRLKQEVAHFKGFTFPFASWKGLTDSSPWILSMGQSAPDCAQVISRRLDALKSVRPAKNARASSIKYGPSILLKGRLSAALAGLIRIDVEHNTNHLLTWDPFFCVEGAARHCEIAKVPWDSPLRYVPNESSVRTKFGSAFSYYDFIVPQSPEKFTATLKQSLQDSKAELVWLEEGDILCSWPMTKRMLPFSHCIIQIKVVRYKRTKALGLQVDCNVPTSRVTLEYLRLKEEITQHVLSILKTISKSK